MEHSTMQEVRGFVQRFCALDSKGSHIDGTFRFLAGPNARRARVARAPVAFGDVEPTYAAVIERLQDLLAAEEGHVWLRAYLTGAEHHSAQMKIEGVIGSDVEPEADPYAEVNGIAGAMVATNKLLATLLIDEKKRNERLQEHQLHAVKTVTHLAIREGLADVAVRQAAVQEGVRQFAPLAKMAVEAWLQGQGRAQPTADDPSSTAAERVRAAVDRIGAEVQLLGVLCADGIPEGADPAVDALRDTVIRIAPALGLTIAGGG